MRANHVETLRLIADESAASLRLDKWLSGFERISSRSRAADLIARGLVTIAGQPLKASYKIKAGDCVEVEIPSPPPTTLQPLDSPLDVLFEDRDLIVINKPSGLVVHPAAGHAQDTLVNVLLHHVSDLSLGFAEHRPGIVHRLDRDTSGVLVVAKNDFTLHALAKQFRDKTVHRIYWALSGGQAKLSGKIESHLGRHPNDRKRFATQPDHKGKLAITHFKLLKNQKGRDGFHWIECRLETGRTHQIRVHLSENGMPILGDPVYGGKFKKSAPRLALHACELGFEHPRLHEKMFFRVGWPEDILSFVEACEFEDLRKAPTLKGPRYD